MKNKKPYLLIDAIELSIPRAAERLAEFLARFDISVLNVAGPRASSEPDAHSYTQQIIARAIEGSRNV
jgi:hypothetical protein